MVDLENKRDSQRFMKWLTVGARCRGKCAAHRYSTKFCSPLSFLEGVWNKFRIWKNLPKINFFVTNIFLIQHQNFSEYRRADLLRCNEHLKAATGEFSTDIGNHVWYMCRRSLPTCMDLSKQAWSVDLRWCSNLWKYATKTTRTPFRTQNPFLLGEINEIFWSRTNKSNNGGACWFVWLAAYNKPLKFTRSTSQCTRRTQVWLTDRKASYKLRFLSRSRAQLLFAASRIRERQE